MNFLQLCQRARQVFGLSGSGPVSVTGQVGEMLEVVTQISWAYEDIQASKPNWNFLRNDFSFDTIVNTSTYATTSVSLEDLATWKIDSLRVYLDTTTDEQWLEFIPWDFFRDSRLFGSSRDVAGRPTEFSIKPDKSLVVWPLPDDEYTIVGEYWKRPQSMSANTSEPLIPQQFHMAIVWRALMEYGRFQESSFLLETGRKEYLAIMSDLLRDQLPPPPEVAPLA